MFKSWFQRKSSDRPASQFLHGPVPRLVLADGASAGPEGPWMRTHYRGPALIPTAAVDKISSSALEKAIRRRAPDVDFGAQSSAEPTKPGHRPSALGYYPEGIKAFEMGRTPLFCGLTYVPEMIPEGVVPQSTVTSCWWWPETREVMARAKAHAVTFLRGEFEKTPVKERILVEMQLVAAALDVLKSPTAVIWPDANAMWQPDQFRSTLDRAKGNIPVSLAVSIKLGRDTQYLHPDGTPKWFARTEGLHAFGLMEVEWRAFAGELETLVQWLQGIAMYLINHGPTIHDGASMRSEAPGEIPNLVIRHESSSTVVGARAYAVYPQRMT